MTDLDRMQACTGCGWLYYPDDHDGGICGVCSRELGMEIDTIESLAVDLRVRKAQAQPRDEADYTQGYEPTVFDRPEYAMDPRD